MGKKLSATDQRRISCLIRQFSEANHFVALNLLLAAYGDEEKHEVFMRCSGHENYPSIIAVFDHQMIQNEFVWLQRKKNGNESSLFALSLFARLTEFKSGNIGLSLLHYAKTIRRALRLNNEHARYVLNFLTLLFNSDLNTPIHPDLAQFQPKHELIAKCELVLTLLDYPQPEPCLRFNHFCQLMAQNASYYEIFANDSPLQAEVKDWLDRHPGQRVSDSHKRIWNALSDLFKGMYASTHGSINADEEQASPRATRPSP